MPVMPGQMNERVTLSIETQVSDGGGGYALGWSDVTTVWARVKPLNAREVAARGGMESSAEFEITIRYSSVVSACSTAWKLLWRGQSMNITAVRNFDEKRIFLTLDCVKGVAV